MDLFLYKVVVIFKNSYLILLGFSRDKYIVSTFLDNKIRIS